LSKANAQSAKKDFSGCKRRLFHISTSKDSESLFSSSRFCIATQNKILLNLHEIEQHIPVTPAADRLTPRGAALVKFELRNTSTLDLLQEQPITSYSKCAVLITTTQKTIGFDNEQSILCFGADGVQTVQTQLYVQKFWGSFVSLIQNSSILLLLVEDILQPEKSLRWQYFDQKFDEHHSFLVNTQDIPISSWLSVAVLAANITAVYWDDNELRVGFYHLSWDSDNLVLHNHIPGNQSSSSTSVSLGDEWENMSVWQEYSRVVVSDETNNILVVLVEKAYSEEEQPKLMLFLRVCLCSRDVAKCSKLLLDSIPVMSTPSFISVAYVQQLLEVEMWVVCVYGQIFSVQTNRDTANILLKHVVSTDLENQHFVKVDNLFYCFRVGNMGKSIEPSIITYLPQFECLRILTGAHVSAVYSVIVIPSLDLVDVQSPSTVTIS
jgi:hypothetical protein